MTAPQPTDFRFVAELPPSRPLLPLEFAVIYLDTDAAGVRARMEEGVISHAWDIGTGENRRELRFYWRSLAAARQSAIGNRQSEMTDDLVYADVIPTAWQRPRACLLYRRWSCSPVHMAELISIGAVKAITETHRGEYGSPEILRESAIAFLQSRRCR